MINHTLTSVLCISLPAAGCSAQQKCTELYLGDNGTNVVKGHMGMCFLRFVICHSGHGITRKRKLNNLEASPVDFAGC